MYVLVQDIAEEVEQMTKEWQKIKTDAEIQIAYDFIKQNKKNRFEREVKIDYERFNTRN